MRTLVVLLALTGLAHADDDDVAKSPLAGGLASAGGTIVAIWGGGGALVGSHYTTSTAAKVGLDATGIASLLVLPSLGHYYVGDWVSTGTIVRGVGLGLLGLEALSDDHNQNDASVLAALGGLAVVTGMVIDIATAPGAVRDHNMSHRISIAPTVASGKVIGLGIGAQF